MRIKSESFFMFIVLVLIVIIVGSFGGVDIEAAREGILYDISFDKEWDYWMEKEGVEYCYSKETITAKFNIVDSEWTESSLKPQLKIAYTEEKQEEPQIIVVKEDPWIYEDDTLKLEYEFSEEGIYRYELTYQSTSGEELCLKDEQVIIIDKQIPTLTIDRIKGEGLRYIGYSDYKYFGKKDCRIAVSAFDGISGVKEVRYRIEEGGKEPVEGCVVNDGGTAGTWICEPICVKSDFRGEISLWAVDFSGHESEVVKTDRVILESEKKHNEEANGELKLITKPSNKVGDVFYFNKNVKCAVKFSDTISGLYQWSFLAGQIEDRGNFWGLTDRTNKWEKEFVIKSSDINQKGVISPVPVTVRWEDNAGHMTTLKKKIVIDEEKPQIKVEWEDSDSKQYYNKKRTAIITVRENNFDEEAVHWQIDGWNEKKSNVSVGPWTHEKETHRCKVIFAEDGEYQWKLKIADLASNESSYTSERFTIDCKSPLVSMKVLGQSAQRFYYNEDVFMELRVKEAYFDEKMAELSINKDGESVAYDKIQWKKEEEDYVSGVSVSEEGRYVINFWCTDKAGNSAEAAAACEFILDKTAPVCKFKGVDNLSTYNGKVMPQVTYGDANLDETSVKIVLSGAKNGKVTYKRYPDKKTAEGKVLRWKDFTRKEKTDDIYRLSVYLKDKSGNETKEEVVFSVNRYGSSYEVGKDTKKLLEGYYTNQDAVVMLTEVNVDTLVKRQVWIKHGENQAFELEEGKDFRVKQSKTQFGWMQYSYRIQKEVFERDGLYKVTFYSKDKAGNEMNNQSRKKEIEFIVDKTAPKVSITGLEEYEYVTKEKIANVQIFDEYGIDSVMIYANDELYGAYTEDEIKKASGRFELKLLPKEEPQEVYVIIRDLAGNRAVTQKVECMIHENVPKAFQNAVKVPEKKEENDGVKEAEPVEETREEKKESYGGWILLCMAAGIAACIFLVIPACKKRHFSIK